MSRPSKRTQKRLTFGIMLFIAAILTYFIPQTIEAPSNTSNSEQLIATFIDVDQGDSFLMETPDNKTVLIDGGDFDKYKTHLLPFLDSRQIDTINTAVVTHYHDDHLGGISELVKDKKVENLILPDYPDEDTTRSELEKLAKKTSTNVFYASAGDTLNLGSNGIVAKVIHPASGGLEGDNFHNNSSLVLHITYGKSSILITGDIESRAEKLISKENIRCDIMKIPHHGSSSSSSKKFLKAADPTYGIISAGKNNRYGHPHYEVLEALDDESITVYRTDRDGHITFTISPEKIQNIGFSK